MKIIKPIKSIARERRDPVWLTKNKECDYFVQKIDDNKVSDGSW